MAGQPAACELTGDNFELGHVWKRTHGKSIEIREVFRYFYASRFCRSALSSATFDRPRRTALEDA